MSVPGPNGYAHMGTCQGRGIVDAVAHHGYLFALCHEFRHLLLLVLGKHFSQHLIHACLAGNSRAASLLSPVIIITRMPM